MCENTQEEFILPQVVHDYNKLRKCLKCSEHSMVVTRVNEAMCKHCFLEYFVHKFRATIGKGRLFEQNEIVLFPFSGSASSFAMLHLINQGISEHAKKKFQFKPVLVYIEDSLMLDIVSHEQRLANIKKIKDLTSHSGFKMFYSLIEKVLNEDEDDSLVVLDDTEVKFDQELELKFKNLMHNITSLTSKMELIKRLKLNLVFKMCEKLKTNKIILATNCTKLTIEILSNVSLGKAAHMTAEVALKDVRKDFSILRPLRELTAKEIAFYNYYNKIEAISFGKPTTFTPINSTIYRLTERFINNLQKVNPTTLATIFRTSDKVTNTSENDAVSPVIDTVNDLCALCQLPIDRKSENATCVINDVQFAKVLTLNSKCSGTSSVTDDSAFSTLRNSTCYSCKLILNDSKDMSMFGDLLIKKRNQQKLKESINDYLLVND